MAGKASRDKGNRREREMVERFNTLAYVSAKRVPLSGACEGYKGDIQVNLEGLATTLIVEVKARAKASGWQSVKKWLGENDMLLLVEDREEPLVVIPWCVLELLLG